jgi:hypothetical protein
MAKCKPEDRPDPAGSFDDDRSEVDLSPLMDPFAGNPERPCYDCGDVLLCLPGDAVDLVVVGETVYVMCGRCARRRREAAKRPWPFSLLGNRN